MVEVAMIDSHRSIRLGAVAGYSNGSVASVSGAAPVPETYPGKSKRLVRIQLRRYNTRARAASWNIIQNNCCVDDCGVRGRASYRRSAFQRNTLCNCDTRSPAKSSGRQRDRIPVQRRVMQSLYTRRRAVGIANRSPGVRSEKAAPKQGTQNGSKRSHNCGLSFLAMRRARSYQNQSSWQVIFLYSGDLFCQQYLSADPTQNFPHPLSTSSAHWQTLEFGCDALQIFI